MVSNFEKKEDVYQLFMQAPVGIYFLRGKDYIIEMANEPILQLWGKGSGVIGKPVLESFPEVKEQGFIELLDGVRTTGKSFQTDEIGVWYNYDGQKAQKYITLLYQPYYEEGEIAGIFSIATDVTEKVLAQKKLKESENNLRNTILQAPVAMCIFRGPSFVVEVANERMFQFWGKPGNAFLGKPIFEGLPEAKGQGFEELLKNVYTTGKGFSALEIPVALPRNNSIEQVFVNFHYEPYREGNGSISGVIAIASEVTEQVKVRKKLENSEQQVRSVIESAPFPIGVYIGQEMVIEFVNQSIIDVWGKGGNVIGKRYADVLPELEGTGIYQQLESVYTTGIPYHARNQRVDLVVDGNLQPFYFNYSFTPLYNAERKIYGVMNTAAEITDLMVARQKIEQSERNFRSMVLQAPVAMCIMLGPDHVVDVANEMMIELWGKKAEDVMHKPIFEALPDAKSQGLEQLLAHVYQTGETFSANEHPVDLIRQGNPETVYQNFVYEPYKDTKDNILGVLAISVDVTSQVLARHKIEEVVSQRTEELAKANQELQRTNSNLEDFAYAASHDMKEPVRKIHFFADRLQSELHDQLSANQKHLFDRLQNASKRMNSLIDDLLMYLQATKGLAEKDTVDLNKKLALVLEDLELEVQQKNAKIRAEHLPIVKGNKRQLQQLLQNLISNALKYSWPDKPPEIKINSQKVLGAMYASHLRPDDMKKQFWLIEVLDNGIGFKQEDAERIFNVFTRLHANTEYRGTGIGLSTVQKVVQNHGGYIWAESKLGEGASFRLLLPVHQ